MLQKQLQVAFVLSGSCSGDSSMALVWYLVRLVGLWASSLGCHQWEGGLRKASSAPAARPCFSWAFNIWSIDLGSSPANKRESTWLIPASCAGVRASSAWQETGKKIMKEAAISWWLVLGGGRRVTLLHFMAVLHLQVPAVSEIAWAGAVLYQFRSQQAPQVKHFIAGVRHCSLLDSLKWKVGKGKEVINGRRKAKAGQSALRSRMCVKQ